MNDAPVVGIVGLGLIGGSLARALRARGRRVVAATRSAETAAAAERLGIVLVDGPADVAELADVVVAATPLPVLPETLAALGAAAAGRSEPPTITDVGSVKAPIATAARRSLPDPASFVPGHPMAGNEGSGWAAGSDDLLDGARWALAVEEPVDLRRWAAVAAVAIDVGATVVPVASDEHDEAVARISHLPYVVAAAAAALVEGEDAALARALAAGSFADLTRVAGGHATLGRDMAVANRAALAPVVADVATRLAATATALEAGDEEAVTSIFAAGHRGRSAMDADVFTGRELTVRAGRDQLLALGRGGGAVTAVGAADPAAVEVTVRTPATAP